MPQKKPLAETMIKANLCFTMIIQVEKAARLDLKIPEWKDGKIIFVDAKEKLKKMSYS
jgi:hypothetical protein